MEIRLKGGPYDGDVTPTTGRDITSARKLLTNRSYGVSYHLCSG